MFLKTATAITFLSLCALAPAQNQNEKVDDNTFYRAFYLDLGEKKSDAAEPLYRKFLAANPESTLAPRAAANLVKLLHRVGKSEEANSLAQQYAALLKAAPKDTPAEPVAQ